MQFLIIFLGSFGVVSPRLLFGQSSNYVAEKPDWFVDDSKTDDSWEGGRRPANRRDYVPPPQGYGERNFDALAGFGRGGNVFDFLGRDDAPLANQQRQRPPPSGGGGPRNSRIVEPGTVGSTMYEYGDTRAEWLEPLTLLNRMRCEFFKQRQTTDRDCAVKLRWSATLAKQIKANDFRRLHSYHTVLKNIDRRSINNNLVFGLRQIFVEMLSNNLQCNRKICAGKLKEDRFFDDFGDGFSDSPPTNIQYKMPYDFLNRNTKSIGCRARLFKKGCYGQRGATRCDNKALRIAILCKSHPSTSSKTSLFRLEDVGVSKYRRALYNNYGGGGSSFGEDESDDDDGSDDDGIPKGGKKRREDRFNELDNGARDRDRDRVGSSRKSEGPKVELLRTNILDAKVDAIINSAPGNFKIPIENRVGLDSEVHRAAGRDLLKYLIAYSDQQGGDKVKAGTVVPSPSYDIGKRGGAKGIIHAIPPRMTDEKKLPDAKELEQLEQCYKKSLDLAVKLGVKSIAIPPIGTGEYFKIPKDQAAQVALKTIVEWMKTDEAKKMSKIQLVIYNNVENYRIYENLIRKFKLPINSGDKVAEKQRNDQTNGFFDDPFDGDQ